MYDVPSYPITDIAHPSDNLGKKEGVMVNVRSDVGAMRKS